MLADIARLIFVCTQVLFREDCTIDQFIDLIEGNRKYVRCLYVYNKIDMGSIEDCRRICAQPDCMVLSCQVCYEDWPAPCNPIQSSASR